MAQIKGVFTWCNSKKELWLIGHEGGPDVFVHYSAIQADGFNISADNDALEFEIILGTKGTQAYQVHVLGKQDDPSQGQPLQLLGSHVR